MKKDVLLLVFVIFFILCTINSLNAFTDRKLVNTGEGIIKYNLSNIPNLEIVGNLTEFSSWSDITTGSSKVKIYLTCGGGWTGARFNDGKIIRMYDNRIEIEINKTNYDGAINGFCIFYNSSYPNRLEFSGDIFLKPTNSNKNVLVGNLWIVIWLYPNGSIDDQNFPLQININYFSDNTASIQDQRISILESWKQPTNNTITSILNTLVTQITRINALENKTCECKINQSILPNYFKYLSSSDRKNIICGYAQDNHLSTISDLGWSCNITYTPLRYGGEKAYCKCKGK